MAGDTDDDEKTVPALPALPATVAQTPAGVAYEVDPHLMANIMAYLDAAGCSPRPATGAFTPPTPMGDQDEIADMEVSKNKPLIGEAPGRAGEGDCLLSAAVGLQAKEPAC